MNKKFTVLCSFILVLSIFLSVTAVADGSTGYYYDNSEKAHEAPLGYTVHDTVAFSGDEYGKITDIATDKAGNIYMLSSQTGGIIRLDNNKNYSDTVYAEFESDDNCIGAEGMFISEYDDGFYIYIADTAHSRIVKIDGNNKVVKIYNKPKTALIADGTEFNPVKITVNETGTMFVLCRGIYSGAVIMNGSGEFLGFYGSNKIKLNATVIYDYFWKNLFGTSKRTDVSRYVPVEFSNLAIDDKGFIYTVTASKADDTGIKYLNFAGENLFPEKSFGDLQTLTSSNEELKTAFTDITFLGNGIIAALDSSRNRVFVYNNSGDLLTVFGGKGNYKNTFITPCAIASYKDGIYVYDTATASLTFFTLNSYGSDLLEASRLYAKGKYDESKELWQSVLEQNNGFQTAYISIGRALMSQNEYDRAMRYFRLGNSKTDYSEAKAQSRKIFLQKYFVPVFIALAVLIILAFRLLSSKRINKKNQLLKAPPTLSYSLFHPIKAGTAFIKSDTVLSKYLIIAVLPVWFVINIISAEYSGFIFNTSNEHPLDLRVEFIATFVIAFVFVLANWLIVTMTEGNGRLKEIATVVALTVIPYAFGKLITVLLSNIMLIDEGVIVNAPVVLCSVWSAVILINGIAKIHEFTVWGAVKNILITIMGMVAIAFLLLLEISIIKQIEVLFGTVIDELIMITG